MAMDAAQEDTWALKYLMIIWQHDLLSGREKVVCVTKLKPMTLKRAQLKGN